MVCCGLVLFLWQSKTYAYDVVISERSDELRFLKVTIEPVTDIQTGRWLKPRARFVLWHLLSSRLVLE